MSLWRLLALGAGVLLLLGVVLAVIVYLPQQAIHPSGLNAAEKVKAIQDLRGTILQGLGGAALLGTLYFSARTLELNRRGQVTERFTKAIDQLGQSEPAKLEVRIGAIYALEQIAKDSKDLHWPVMEILTAFLRVHFWWDPEDAETEDKANQRSIGWRADLRSATTVIGRRQVKHELPTQSLDLHNADLRAVVWKAVHLKAAQLQRANLSHAILEEAHLEGADFGSEYLSMRMIGRRPTADYPGAHLKETNLERAHLQKANLKEANLTDARLQGALNRPGFLGDFDGWNQATSFVSR